MEDDNNHNNNYEVDDIELEDVDTMKVHYPDKSSKTGPKTTPTKENVQFAAALINAAYTEMRYTKRMIRYGHKTIFWYKLSHNTGWIKSILMIILIMLSFFERPAWCYHSNCNMVKNPGKVVDGVTPILYFSGFPILDQNIGLGIEIFCLVSIWLSSSFFALVMSGPRDFFTKRSWPLTNTIIIFVCLVDIIVSFCVDRTWRLSQFFRPILMVLYNKQARKTAVYIFKDFHKILEVMLLTAFVLAFFSWMGLLLWFQKYNQTLYNDIHSAIASTQILLTTCNFPDVMIPFFRASWWSSAFFVSFFVFGYYLFHPIVLAITFQTYKTTQKNEKSKKKVKQQELLTLAFKQLDPNNSESITFDNFCLLLNELSNYSELPLIKHKNYKFFFSFACGQKDHMSLNDMLGFNKSLGTKFFSKREPNTHKLFPAFFQSGLGKSFVKIFTSQVYDISFHLIYFVNLGLVIYETVRLVQGEKSSYAVEVIELFFNFLYTIEILLRATAFGFKIFFRKFFSKIEIVTELANLVAQLVFLGDIRNQSIMRTKTLIILRIIRLLKLVTLIPIYRLLVEVIAKFGAHFAKVLTLLMSVYLFCAFVGVVSFGGLLYRGNGDLVGSAYDASNYYYYHFNDFPTAFVVNFNLQVTNNWNVMFDGVERASTTSARLYFVIFWTLSVVVITNVFVALLIEGLLPRWDKLRNYNKENKKNKKRRKKNGGGSDDDDDYGQNDMDEDSSSAEFDQGRTEFNNNVTLGSGLEYNLTFSESDD